MSILFDLDGTLLDTAGDFAHAANQMLKELGQKPITVEELKPAVSNGLAELIHFCFNIKPDNPQYPVLSQKLIAYYEEIISVHTKPFPGIIHLLDALEKQNLRWGIVTNRRSRYTHQLLHATGLLNRASCVVCGDTTNNPKPHPEPLFFACKALDIEPKHCIYIGDAERDIQAGKAAGMATLGVLFGYIPDIQTALEWGADDYVYHADEILEKILLWQKR
jgi:2-phosphoglycolate phosphatase